MDFLSQTVRQSHSNQASMNQLQMHQPQLKQTEAFQPQPVVTSSTLENGQLHCPVQLCPKNDHCSKSYTTLSNHVIWHRKLLDDPDHHVPETLFAKSVCRLCNTCRASVCPNPQTHQNLVVTDSMPFPSTLMRDTPHGWRYAKLRWNSQNCPKHNASYSACLSSQVRPSAVSSL